MQNLKGTCFYVLLRIIRQIPLIRTVHELISCKPLTRPFLHW